MRRRLAVVAPLIASLTLALGGVRADQAPLVEEKPFADTFVLLQVSDGRQATFSKVLDIAANLLKHYGQDRIDLEVIAFAAGVPLLFARDNPERERIHSLQAHGVRFHVCGNTLDTIARNTGTRPEVLPDVITVQSGVAFLIDEQRRGYVVVRP